jgi:hypothetical protein
VTAKVVVLELGEQVELVDVLGSIGQLELLKGSGTVVHAAVDDAAEAILAFAKGHRTWPPPHHHK